MTCKVLVIKRECDRYDDDYLEAMGKYYTSETVTKLFPYIREIPFEEWLRRKHAQRIKD